MTRSGKISAMTANLDQKRVEESTAKLYEDIHPYVDVEYTIGYYLDAIQRTMEYFRGKHILDCGFGGTGWASELFARSGAASVTGVDLNPRWKERIERRLTKYGVPMDFRQGNVLDLPFEDNAFDYVHSHGVMHHTVDWKKGVSEMVRVLKPGGTMYLGMYGKFGPIGAASYAILRGIAKIIPYSWASNVVQKTGFFRHSEYSILDLMYAPVEEHLSQKTIYDHLKELGQINIRNHQNPKWRDSMLSNRLLFGKHIHHAFVCEKPLPHWR
jgi:ubiquinone/menaquinone biosynthesis C-methylase UbiE